MLVVAVAGLAVNLIAAQLSRSAGESLNVRRCVAPRAGRRGRLGRRDPRRLIILTTGWELAADPIVSIVISLS